MISTLQMCYFVLLLSASTIEYEIDIICTNSSSHNVDHCWQKHGPLGTYTFLENCAATLEASLQQIVPEKICGTKNARVIVCCKAPPLTLETTSIATSDFDRKPGDISKKKCQDYISRIIQPIVYGPTAMKVLSRKEFPHMAHIGYKTSGETVWACGGSLISENFVLTAAHCLQNTELGEPKLVRFGIIHRTDTAHQRIARVSEVIVYPEYVEKYHDIGLLRLEEGLVPDIFVRPACLHVEKNIPNNILIATGWGKTSYAGESSADLLKVNLEMFDTERCNRTYKRDIKAPFSDLQQGIREDIMVCAGSTTDIKDVCEGDSGGPLQVEIGENIYSIVGVTSFGKYCGFAKNVPGVYTRVSAYIQWIEDIVWPKQENS